MEENIGKAPVLNKHVGLIHCEGRLTLLQRKICNILLFNALAEINNKDIFEIGLNHLCSLIGYKSNDILLIKKAIVGLISLVLEWNLLDRKTLQPSMPEMDLSKKPNISWHASSLLAGVSIEAGTVSYSYSPQIKKVISSLDIYGRINLFVQAKFKSTYSLALYENCIRFKNIKQTCLFELAVFRSLMGVEKNKYLNFKELNRNVILPAVQEINQKSDICLEVDYKKIGRSVVGLKFYIADNDSYLPKLKRKEKKLSDAATTIKKVLLSTFKLNETDAQYIVERYELGFVRTKLDEIFRSNAYKNHKIHNISAYINSILESENQLKAQIPAVQSEETLLSDKPQEVLKAFNNQYIKYKTVTLMKALEQCDSSTKEAIYNDYKNQLELNSSILLKSFMQKKFESPMVLADFLLWMSKYYPAVMPEFFSYDEFITEEAVM